METKLYHGCSWQPLSITGIFFQVKAMPCTEQIVQMPNDIFNRTLHVLAELGRKCTAEGCTLAELRGCVRHLIVYIPSPPLELPDLWRHNGVGELFALRAIDL